MSVLLEQLSQLSAAEDFLAFFDVSFDEDVVHVHRLHILKRFYQYLRREEDLEELGDVQLRDRYRSLLQRAHDDFVASTAARERVFKVFEDARERSFPLEKLSSTLPSRS